MRLEEKKYIHIIEPKIYAVINYMMFKKRIIEFPNRLNPLSC